MYGLQTGTIYDFCVFADVFVPL